MRINTLWLAICFLFVSQSGWGAVPAARLPDGQGRQEELVSLNFENANLFDVVGALTQKAGLNLILSNDYNLSLKKVSLKMKSIAPLEAIDLVLSSQGYTFQKTSNTLLVSTLPADLKTSAYKLKAEEIRLKFIASEKASSVINKIFPDLTVSPGNSSNSLVLKGKLNEIESAKQLLCSLDIPKPQVLIESKIIEIAESGIQQLGVVWGKETGTFKISPAETLQATLNALISKGEAKVVANPRVTTLDNQEAVINIGSKMPYAVPVTNSSGTAINWTVQYIDAGVNLKITPTISQENIITAKIHPEVSSISEWRTTAAGDFPVISTRNADVSVQIKNGETIAIAGLINELDRKNLSQLPILGNLPVLGKLFQTETTEKNRTEIIFLIRPLILQIR